ncbi:hypothetical protein M513_13387 [Trichuris suis]|uniref:Uncharacterized protein n=1 Tax=Trichuris suis TaxID=68888 RepID=A0A085LL82_9BILA|nr:hypothetical protein M513_13387 [Trichuris suis]
MTKVVVRTWRMESRNRIDSSTRRITFATVAGDGVPRSVPLLHTNSSGPGMSQIQAGSIVPHERWRSIVPQEHYHCIVPAKQCSSGAGILPSE